MIYLNELKNNVAYVYYSKYINGLERGGGGIVLYYARNTIINSLIHLKLRVQCKVKDIQFPNKIGWIYKMSCECYLGI